MKRWVKITVPLKKNDFKTFGMPLIQRLNRRGIPTRVVKVGDKRVIERLGGVDFSEVKVAMRHAFPHATKQQMYDALYGPPAEPGSIEREIQDAAKAFINCRHAA